MHKETLKIVVTGHIDHGKSTLIGRLLLATNSLSKDKLREIKEISKSFGKDTELAWLADQLKEERENNITIETTEIFLKTRQRDYCLIDTPGHVEFIKNMLTGASRADAALLIIDSDEGAQEQTRRHAYLLKLLALNNIIVIINKMDRVHYDKIKFQKIKEEISSFLKGLDINIAALIPVSAKEGVNISKKARETQWYEGPALLPAMDALRVTEKRCVHRALRFPVQDIYKINGDDVLVGKITSGSLRQGEKVILLPSRENAIIRKIRVYGQKRTQAEAQENIGVTLSPCLKAKRGDVLCAPGNAATSVNRFKGNIFWMSDTPLKKNDPLTIRCATQERGAVVENIEERINSSTLEILGKDSKELKKNEAGIVTFRLTTPAVIERFSDIPSLGRYVVQRDNSFQGAGTVIEKY